MRATAISISGSPSFLLVCQRMCLYSTVGLSPHHCEQPGHTMNELTSGYFLLLVGFFFVFFFSFACSNCGGIQFVHVRFPLPYPSLFSSLDSCRAADDACRCHPLLM